MEWRSTFNHSILLFYFGLVNYHVSNWLQNTAINWWAYRITGNSASVGAVQFLQYLPLLILFLWGGLLIDRTNKVLLLIFTQTFLFTFSILLFLLALLNSDSFLLLSTAVFIMGIFKAIDIPLRQTLLANLIKGEALRGGVAVNALIVNGSRFIGPFLFGLISQMWSFPSTILASSLLIAINLSVIPFIRFETSSGRKIGGFADGFSFIRSNKGLRSIFLLVSMVGILGWSFHTILPEYSVEVLDLPESSYGYIASFSGIGSLVGSIVVLLIKRISLNKFILISLLFNSLGLSIWFFSDLADVRSYIPLLFSIFLIGFSLSLFYTSANATVQILTPDFIRGRVLSAYTSIFVGFQPVGHFIIGWTAYILGLRGSLYVMVFLSLLTLLMWIRIKKSL